MEKHVHPHVGFLNTTFEIFGIGTTTHIKLVQTADEYGIPNIKSKTNVVALQSNKFKIPNPGTYSVYLNEEKVDSIVVKDALRFGGSSFKNAYVFEGTPWCFVVMRDRSYFYNRDTTNSFSESISPDSIRYISPSVIVMENNEKQDCTLFSLITMKGFLNFSREVYLSDNVLITTNENNLCLYKFTTEVDNHRNIHYDDFIIGEDNALYILNNSTLERYSLDTFELLYSKDLAKSNEEFVCFVQKKFMLTARENDYSQLLVTNISTGKFLKLLNLDSAIKSVNGKEINKIDFDLLTTKLGEVQDDPSCKVSIEARAISIEDLYALDQYFYTIQTCLTLKLFRTRQNTLYHRLYRTTSVFCNDDVIFTTGKNCYSKILACQDDCLYVKYGTTTLVINSGQIKYKTNDDVHINNKKNTVVFIEQKDDTNSVIYFFSKDGSKRATLSTSNSISWVCFEEHSIIIDEGRHLCYRFTGSDFLIKTYPRGYWCKNNLENSLICGGTYIIFHNKYLGNSNLPANLKCISENCKYGITVRGEKVTFVRFIDDSYQEINILEDIFDATNYRNVILSDDGQMFIYRKNDKCVLVDTSTGESEDFANDKYITHVNGYRSTFIIDSYRKPRIIDPLTMNFIEDTHTSKFLFVSPDGKFYADTRLDDYVKIYNQATESYITNEERERLRQVYDSCYDMSNREKDELQKRRRLFINRHSKLMSEKGYFLNNIEHLLTTNNFTEIFIEERGFAKIRKISDDSIVANIELGKKLWFINYVSFSSDNRYVAIAGRYPNGSSLGGLLLVYDLFRKEIINKRTKDYAMWTVSFNLNNDYAAYDSRPTTFFGNVNNFTKETDIQEIDGRSFLAFSSDGKYMALSNQGYIPHSNRQTFWGHRPSTDVYIYECGKFKNQKYPTINDLSDCGIDSQKSPKTVATVSFSKDNSKIMMAGTDGVVIIRNINLH